MTLTPEEQTIIAAILTLAQVDVYDDENPDAKKDAENQRKLDRAAMLYFAAAQKVKQRTDPKHEMNPPKTTFFG